MKSMVNNEEFKQLNNPPIKEVIIGFFIDGLFIDKNEIKIFCDNFSEKDKYIKQESIKSVTFDLSDETKVYQNVSEGIVLKTINDEEVIHIEPNKIMFIDRTKYKGFTSFFSKFEPIIENIKKSYDREIEISDIGLRYVNNFTFHIEDVQKKLKITPSVEIENEKFQYALFNNYLSVANITSTFDNNTFATVKIMFQVANPVSLNITFDIDAHLNQSYKLNDLNELARKVEGLKNFKNQIFFSNFIDIYDIEEFK